MIQSEAVFNFVIAQRTVKYCRGKVATLCALEMAQGEGLSLL